MGECGGCPSVGSARIHELEPCARKPTGAHHPRAMTHIIPPISRLSADVLEEILGHLDSVSLSFAIRAHRVFWTTFRICQQRILRGLLLQLIKPELLPLTLVTQEATSINVQDWDQIRCLLARLNNSRVTPNLSHYNSPLTLRAVLEIEITHRTIENLASSFAGLAMMRSAANLRGTTPGPPNPIEELRIHRAFYRFQLYCNIFGRRALEHAGQTVPKEESCGRDGEDLECELDCFFWPWPPWVNEQLACVFEYLEDKLSVYFDDVAAHDVEWGWKKVDWVDPTVAVSHRRSFLFNGLDLVHRLKYTCEFSTLKSLLESADLFQPHGKRPIFSLADSLAKSVKPDLETTILPFPSKAIGRYKPHHLQPLIPVNSPAWPSIDDPSTLPVHLWRHAHYHQPLAHSTFQRENTILRDGGYVFWDWPAPDEERVPNACDLGSTPEILARMESCAWKFEGRLLPREVEVKKEEMRRSWRRRREIWENGGEGHWVEGDERGVRYGRCRG